MNTRENNEIENVTSKPRNTLIYTTPVLLEYGSIIQLTQAGSLVPSVDGTTFLDFDPPSGT